MFHDIQENWYKNRAFLGGEHGDQKFTSGHISRKIFIELPRGHMEAAGYKSSALRFKNLEVIRT